MTSKKELYVLPVPSTNFSEEGYLDGRGPSPAIRYSYLDNGAIRNGGIAFNKVLATRTREERSCTAWHIKGAYDTLVEISDSSWAEELRADTQEQWRNTWEINHYMLYLDSVGCFEVLAESWIVF
jgi:hypothetical protein